MKEIQRDQNGPKLNDNDLIKTVIKQKFNLNWIE